MDIPILTPDQRVRVFVSSTLGELATERGAVRRAVERLQLLPVMFELGARPHPPRQLYRAYLAQSHVFLAVYWERYGWVAPGEQVSGLEDEYLLCGDLPRLVYVKEPAPGREPRLQALLARIQEDDRAAYKHFGSMRELAQLVARDLAVLLSERFRMPPAAEADVPVERRRTLPIVPTSFVGRERERAELSRLVGNHSMVTVLGPGGAGKTRLAVEASRQAAHAFGGRVCLVELAAVASEAAAESVPRAVVDALGLADVSQDDRAVDDTARLVRALRGPRTLLVLDNCEHVLDAAAQLTARIVADCPHAHVLATGREALGVPGETLAPVGPLAADAAVQLFADRAAALRPGFAVTAENRPAIEEICRRLDSLPLAIELAAARVKVLPPAEIARRLDDRFRLLRAGSRTAEPRQQTLHAMVDWSYALLSEPERQVFARLAVFAGGIPLDGAEAVCAGGGVDALDVLDVVARLVDKSLVVAEYDEAGTPRFRMLETLRAYALEQLDASGEREEVDRRHATYLTEVAESAWAGLRGPGQATWFARVDREHDNIRTALGWATGHDAELAQRIAGHVAWFWWLRNHEAEGETWLRKALDAPGAAPLSVTARARAFLALFLQERAEFAGAEKAVREALADAQDGGGERLALARLILALVVGSRGEYEEAFDLLDQGEASADPWTGAVSDLVRTQLLSVTDRSAMRTVAARAVDRFAAIGDRWGELDPRMQLALDAEQHGDTATAAEHYERCLSIARDLGFPSYEAMFVTHLGSLAVLTGDLDRAEALHEQAVATFARVGSPAGVAFARGALADLAIRRGDLARARATYEEVLTYYRDADVEGGLALTLTRLGFLAERDGDLPEARARHLESLDVAVGLRHAAATASALEGLAGAAAAGGDAARAARLIGGAAALRERADVPVGEKDSADVQRALDRTRAALPEDAFEAAFDAGRGLSLPELVDLAHGPGGDSGTVRR